MVAPSQDGAFGQWAVQKTRPATEFLDPRKMELMVSGDLKVLWA